MLRLVAYDISNPRTLRRAANVFVPPPRTRGLRDGDRVKGTAVLELDRKKGRESWSAAVIRRL